MKTDAKHSVYARRARQLLLLVVCLTATVIFAAPDPVMRRGFSPDGVYNFDGIDAVDLYTGNLTVQIPLGQQYQTNGALSYQFKLTYNSSLWDYWDQYAPTISGGMISYFEHYAAVTTWNREDGSGFSAQEALPTRTSNAGLGWRVSLGDIEGGLNNDALVVRYVDESGNAHTFYSKLHGNLTTDSETLEDWGPFYTRDGSYLRMRRTDTTGTGPIKVEIDSPDGVTRKFSCSQCKRTGVLAARWNLDEIVDQYGNALVITRANAAGADSPGHPPEGQDWIWTFTEKSSTSDEYPDGDTSWTTVRVHTAKFRVARVYMANGFEAASEIFLKELTLAACCDSTSTARYEFDHNNTMNVYRPPQSSWNGPGMVITNSGDGYINPYLLRSVKLPDVKNANGDSDTAGRWEFEYVGDSTSDDILKVPGSSDLKRATTADASARLKVVRYPSGGGMRYEYQRRGFLKINCDQDYAKPIVAGRYQRFLAVSKRQPFTVGGDTINAWHYTFAKYGLLTGEKCGGFSSSTMPKDVTASVIDPSGKATVTYFSNFVGHDHADSTWTHTEFGLPFTKHEPDPLGGGRYLSEEVYDCSAINFGSSVPVEVIHKSVARSGGKPDVPSCSGPLRKTYVRFENSGVACDLAAGLGNCSNAGRRLASARTEYRDFCTKDNQPFCKPNLVTTEHRWLQNDYSNFDGLGHYRTEKVSGTFYSQAFGENTNAASADQRTTTTLYNDGTTFDATSKVFAGRDLSKATTPWLLETYTLRKVTAFDTSINLDKTQYTHYRFDPATGALVGWRRLKNLGGLDTHDPNTVSRGTVHENDVMMRQVRARTTGTGLGNPVTITHAYYPAPKSVLATNALDAALPATADYAIKTTLAHGGAARVEYVCGTESYQLIEQNVVNQNTGLVTASKDAWGVVKNVSTTYTYDVLGRFVTVTAPGEVPVKYNYPFMSAPASQWTVTATQASANGAGTRKQEYVYDSLGRLVDTKNMVDGSMSWIRRRYGANMRIVATSNEGLSGAILLHDTETMYDVFGRPVLVSSPGEAHDVRVTYYGIQRAYKKTDGVAAGKEGAPTSKGSTSYVDVMGRTIKIDDAEANRTTYSYDYADRLTGVDMDAQKRRFTYDGRGFLTHENIPELLHQGIEYDLYDTRGNVGRRRLYDSNARTYTAGYTLEYVYDKAERLVAVKGGNKTLKTFQYVNGRLKTSGRTNDVPNGQATKLGTDDRMVTTTFDYDDPGRLKKKTIQSGFTAEIEFPSNDLGLVTSVKYPLICPLSGNCTTPTGPNRTVTLAYEHGSLNAVTSTVVGSPAVSLISGITYHPNGLWHKVTRGNGTTDEQSIEHDYRRPQSIKATKSSGNAWASGAIHYDGYGNVRKIDNDSFAYDGLGRLLSATQKGMTQTATYDRFGNMLTMATGGVSTSFTYVELAKTASNRLSKIGDQAVSFDAAGNMDKWKDPRNPNYEMTLVYDLFNMVNHAVLKNAAAQREFGRVYLYDASDERVAVIDYALKGSASPAVREVWSLRGPSNEVLRDVIHEKARGANGAWTWKWGRDYVYRNAALFAEIVPLATGTGEVVRHLHTDHLGSVRAVTETSAALKEQRSYYAFGQPVAATNSATRMAFTGHEHDDDGTSSPYNDLDYMHARYYSAVIGRFLSLDPVRGTPASPQTWNRYAYARNNPLTTADSTGRLPDNEQCVPNETGCAITVTAEDPAKQANYGLNYETGGRQYNATPKQTIYAMSWYGQTDGFPWLETMYMTPAQHEDVALEQQEFLTGFGDGVTDGETEIWRGETPELDKTKTPYKVGHTAGKGSAPLVYARGVFLVYKLFKRTRSNGDPTPPTPQPTKPPEPLPPNDPQLRGWPGSPWRP